MTQEVKSVEFDSAAATAAWDRLLSAYAGARADDDLVPHWTDLVGTVTSADADQVDEEVRGYAPQPAHPREREDVVVEVLNGVSDIVVRLCADVVLYDDESTAEQLVAEARRPNDRYCDLYDLVVERHPDAPLGDGGGDDETDEVETPPHAAVTTPTPAPVASAPVAPAPAAGPAPWLHRTGAPVDSDALAGLVKRLVSAYAERGDAVTLEAMWRSAFAAASGCDAAAVQEVCETARLPGTEMSQTRAANEVAAGFEELFAAAVVRLFAADGNGDGDLADEARRLVQRRDALFDLMEETYPGMYDAD
ncbi:MAG: hypothetical protein GEV10_05225 [Streptosporangiales bacterium]|nr:hypothetical protein [Streptosporangiales bacterium]